MADHTSEAEPSEGQSVPHVDEQEKLAPEDAAFVKSMRQFVLATASGIAPHKEDKPQFKLLQAVSLLFIALDVALLYLLLQEWLENPLLQFAVKVLPWLLGATAVTYFSEQLRDLILALSRRKSIALIAAFIAFPLLISRQPVFSMLVDVDSEADVVEPFQPNDKNEKNDKIDIEQTDAKSFRVLVPDLLKAYHVTVKDPSTDKASHGSGQLSSSFSPLLHRSEVVRATFAQIPWIGGLFGKRAKALSPLYQVGTNAPSGKTTAQVLITGDITNDFLEFLKLSDEQACTQRPRKNGSNVISCHIGEGMDALYLPSGKYDLTVNWDKCTKGPIPMEVRRENNSTIDVEKICAH